MRITATDIDAVSRLVPLLTELVGAWSRRKKEYDKSELPELNSYPSWTLEDLLARQEGVKSPEQLAEEGLVREVVGLIQGKRGWQG